MDSMPRADVIAEIDAEDTLFDVALEHGVILRRHSVDFWDDGMVSESIALPKASRGGLMKTSDGRIRAGLVAIARGHAGNPGSVEPLIDPPIAKPAAPTSRWRLADVSWSPGGDEGAILRSATGVTPPAHRIDFFHLRGDDSDWAADLETPAEGLEILVDGVAVFGQDVTFLTADGIRGTIGGGPYRCLVRTGEAAMVGGTARGEVVWFEDGEELRRTAPTGTAIRTVASWGPMIAAGYEDGSVELLVDGHVVATGTLGGRPRSLRFTRDGRQIVAALDHPTFGIVTLAVSSGASHPGG
jgi:hypothetical protein